MNTQSPEEIIFSNNPIPFLRLANPQTVFTQRAHRLTTLSEKQDFLAFLSSVATAQQAVLTQLSPFTAPDTEKFQECRAHGLAPLSIYHWQRPSLWLDIFDLIIKRLRAESSPGGINWDTSALPTAAVLEKQADYLLTGEYSQVDVKLAPVIGAALQVYWVAMATTLGEAAFTSTAIPQTTCPVCGMPPLASIIDIGKTTDGLRYLCCPLCASKWHLVRIKCAHCDSTQGISYYELAGSQGAVKAEVCDSCHTYLKIFYLTKDTAMEPVADDLATLVLDILVQEMGKNRLAPNLYFHPGTAD